MAAIAYAPGDDALAVHVRPGGQIVEHARKHPLRPHVRLHGRIAGARHIHGDHTNTAAEQGVASLNFVLLARIRSIDHEDERRGPHILRQSDIAWNFLALKRDVYVFDGWIEELSVISKCR